MTQNRKSILILLVVTILLTTIIVTLSQSISQSYFKTHTFFWDPVMAYSRNIVFYERMEAEADLNPIASRVNFAELYFKGEPKAPIYGLPIILFAPKLLLSPWANLPVSSLMFAVFLFILGYSIFLRTKHIVFSFSIMCISAAAPVYFDPIWGIASSWYDLPAGFLLAASIIAFINWHTYRKTIWLVLFPTLLSFSILGRYVISAYGFVIIAPLFIYSIIDYYIKEKKFLKNIMYPVLVVLFLCLIICGYFLIIHFEFTYNYYSKMSYGIAGSILDSIKICSEVFTIIGITYVLTMVFLLLLIIAYIVKIYKKIQFKNILFYTWIISALPLYLVVIVRSMGNHHTSLIELPIMSVLSIGLGVFLINNKKLMNYISIGFFIISLLFIISSYLHFSKFSITTNCLEKEDKELTKEISKQVKNLPPDKTWASFFAPDHSRVVNCECFYNYKVYPKTNSDVTFYGYSTYWKFFYTDKTVDEISQIICEGIEKSDVFITFNSKVDVNNAIKPNQLDDFKTAKQITYNVVDYMNTNPNWKKQEIISTIQYSNLALYRKK